MDDEIFNFRVYDRYTFVKFLELLRKDLSENSDEWENTTLDRFLEAMTGYTQDIQGFYDNTGQKINADEPSWKLFADILIGTSIYE